MPPPEMVGLSGPPRPSARSHLRAYRPETSIAEKTEAMVPLALANSRMKDFFDIFGLAETRTFDGETMRLAVAATFARRRLRSPANAPRAHREFAEHPQKRRQWAAFVRRTRRPDLADLTPVVEVLAGFLWPVLEAARKGELWLHKWKPGGPWKK